MLHQAYLTDWHHLFLVAAGFLTAILTVWIQTRQSAFYNEKDYDTRCEQDRLFSSNIAGLWLSVGVFFALLAFGLTVLDWLLIHQQVHLYLASYQIPIEKLAAGFLIGAFDITLVAVLEVICTAGRVLKEKGVATQIRIHYTDEKKRCLFIATCVALSIILAFCLFQAFIPISPTWWFWLTFCSLIIPGLLLAVTYKCVSCQRSSQDPCCLRDFILSWGKDCHRFCHKNR